MFTGYLNLENYVKAVIIGCIDHQGYIEGGHLRHVVDLHLAAGPSGVEFAPCEINEEDVLKVSYKQRSSSLWEYKDFNIQEIIEEYLER